jgi:hypothetical protein
VTQEVLEKFLVLPPSFYDATAEFDGSGFVTKTVFPIEAHPMALKMTGAFSWKEKGCKPAQKLCDNEKDFDKVIADVHANNLWYLQNK